MSDQHSSSKYDHFKAINEYVSEHDQLARREHPIKVLLLQHLTDFVEAPQEQERHDPEDDIH